MKRSAVLMAFFGFGLSLSVQAQPYSIPPSFSMPQAYKQPALKGGPVATVKEGMNKLTTFLSKKRGAPKPMKEFLANEVVSYFDFDTMTRMAAGPMLRRMGGQNQAKYVEMIKQDFLTVLAQRLAGFSNQKAKVISAKPGRSGRVVVTIAIGNPRSYPTRLDFRMGKTKQGWKIYDVVANGSSAVMYYRRMLAQSMRPGANRRLF